MKRVYQNADVCVDTPGNLFFEEILEAFPDCKVILSERGRFVDRKRCASSGFIECFTIQDCIHVIANGEENGVFLDSLLNFAIGSCNTKSTYVIRKRYRMEAIT